jgi:hypothetical protein
VLRSILCDTFIHVKQIQNFRFPWDSVFSLGHSANVGNLAFRGKTSKIEQDSTK